MAIRYRRWDSHLLVVMCFVVSLAGIFAAAALGQEGQPAGQVPDEESVGRAVEPTGETDEVQTTPPLLLPENLMVQDLPNDEGDTVLISWDIAKEQARVWAGWTFEIMRSLERDGTYEFVEAVNPVLGEFEDRTVIDGTTYYYKMKVLSGESSLLSEPLGPVVPQGSWFDWQRLNALIFLVIFTALLTYYILVTRRGRELQIRKVTGLAAVDEAVGRATEMGRKILYIPGIAEISEIQTVAGLSILGHIAKTAVEYATRILVPNMDPLTYAAAREIVQEAYLTAGRPEAFQKEDVYYVTSEQFAYTAAVTGLMVRERPAANFFIGWFKAESLMLAETGQATGAIQIAGTAELDQLPFFVATCDYTLIGEELYAASAYLTRHPLLLASIKGQDMAKAGLMAVIIIGLIAHFFQIDFIRDFLTIK